MIPVRSDIELRGAFSALQGPLAFFDGPGGTQVPDSVVEAIGVYLRETNANIGGAFQTSREAGVLMERAHDAAARFLGAGAGDVAFGANMTTLNFALSRTAARDWHAGDEVICTKLDHDANISPWLELAHDMQLLVKLAEVDDDCRLDLDHLASLLSPRTRVVAYPLAANSVGTVTPAAEIAAIAHEAGALAWIDAVHYAPHGPIDVRALGADVLFCSPYKFYGPHLGLAYVRRNLADAWRPYKVRPAESRFETGTQPLELMAGFLAAVRYLERVGWGFIQQHEHALGQLFLDRLPAGWRLYGIPTMEDRVPTFAITSERVSPADAAEELGRRGFAVWSGDYYAVEIMRRLGLPEGAVRIGVVHYNTEAEVDGLLAALAEIG